MCLMKLLPRRFAYNAVFFLFQLCSSGLSKNLRDYVVSVIVPSAFMLLEVLG